MRLLTLLLFLAATVSAQRGSNVVIVQAFDSTTCNGVLGSAVVTENGCSRIDNANNPPVHGSFKILGVDRLGPDCRVVFNTDSTCRNLRAGVVLEPSAADEGRCFNSLEFRNSNMNFLTIFCS